MRERERERERQREREREIEREKETEREIERERKRQRERERERERGGWMAKRAFFCQQGRNTNYTTAGTKRFFVIFLLQMCLQDVIFIVKNLESYSSTMFKYLT
jgi:hypothetical protein